MLPHNLIGGAHFKEASTSIIVTVPDSLNYSFNFGHLYQIKNLKLYSNLEGVASGVIFFKHDGGEEIFVIDRSNIFNHHEFDLLH